MGMGWSGEGGGGRREDSLQKMFIRKKLSHSSHSGHLKFW